MHKRREQEPPSRTTNTVEGDAGEVFQLGSSHGNIGFFRGNNFMFNLGPRWAVVIIVCLLVVAAAVAVVFVRSSPSKPSEPLAVAVKSVTDACQMSWVSPKSPTELAPVSDPSIRPNQYATWEHSRDGAQASKATFTVTAQGHEATSNVVITGIRVKVLERKPPLKGTLLSGQCGEPVNAHYVEVDLDSEQPVSFPDDLAPDTAAELTAQGLRADPIRLPYSVSSTQPEVFTVVAGTASCDCTWVIELDWSAGGKSGVQTVGNNGKPFRTTSSTNAAVCYMAEPFYCT
ncbi:hypothetical protein SAMN04488564_107308 [Lentzea waywayandensis]|uniref:Uncharacterized protein n=1 Tax=Lentzea waywayandensis TaxID=84724 RepID=A0A1I6F2G9_9PSEU|nr:hypothetical protein [Lentzea waywayandensis]SFR24113.1 hypothetical protein SAMN04488564_107308 [Lentzea waywayandensis]